MTEPVTLDVNESLAALKEATKIQIAVNYARLVVPTHDEDGNEVSDEEFQNNLNEVFAEIAGEFEQTLLQAARRILEVKKQAKEHSSGLYVVDGGGDGSAEA